MCALLVSLVSTEVRSSHRSPVTGAAEGCEHAGYQGPSPGSLQEQPGLGLSLRHLASLCPPALFFVCAHMRRAEDDSCVTPQIAGDLSLTWSSEQPRLDFYVLSAGIESTGNTHGLCEEFWGLKLGPHVHVRFADSHCPLYSSIWGRGLMFFHMGRGLMWPPTLPLAVGVASSLFCFVFSGSNRELHT